jgi:hypothetical protein
MLHRRLRRILSTVNGFLGFLFDSVHTHVGRGTNRFRGDFCTPLSAPVLKLEEFRIWDSRLWIWSTSLAIFVDFRIAWAVFEKRV